MRKLFLATIAIAALAAVPAFAEGSGNTQWYESGVARDKNTPVSPMLLITAAPTAVFTPVNAIATDTNTAANLKYQSGLKGMYEECWAAYRAHNDWLTSALLIVIPTCPLQVTMSKGANE